MTVNELRHRLFDIDNQGAEIIVMVDGTPFSISNVVASEVDQGIVYLTAE